jgi:hypothetical protein
MAITLNLDLLDPAATFDQGEDGTTIVRIGLAEGIPIDTPASVLPLALTAAGMPGYGEAHPTVPACRVRRTVIRPVDAGDKARVELYYSTDEVGGEPNGTFVLKDSTALTQELVELDGNFEPIVVSFTPDASSASQVDKVIRTPRLTPMRTFTVFAVVQNRPGIGTLLTVGKVNDRQWQGLPKGYWICSGVEATSSDAVGAIPTLTVAASFLTRQYRDWSEYGFYIDSNGDIPATDANFDAGAIRGVMESSYRVGLDQSAQAFTKVGHYQMADFAGIFGI